MAPPRSIAPNCGSVDTMCGQIVAMQCHPPGPAIWQQNVLACQRVLSGAALKMRLSTGFRLHLHCNRMLTLPCVPQMKTLFYCNPAILGWCDYAFRTSCEAGRAWKRVPFKDFRQPLKSLQQPVSSASFSSRCLSSCICRTANTALPTNPMKRHFCNVRKAHESDNTTQPAYLAVLSAREFWCA